MVLNRLRIRRFRNVREADVPFPGRVTVFNGDNAQGKTNLIEALSVLSTLRSFRTRRAAELVMDGEAGGEVEGEVTAGPLTTRLHLSLDRQGKTAKIDGRIPTSAREYLATLQPVLFTPWDLELSLGSQETRRAYADRAAFLADAAHLRDLRTYSRLIRQRNAALRVGGSNLAVWDEQLATTGTAIRRARQKVVESLSSLLMSVHGEVSGGAEQLEISWEGAWTQNGADPNALREDLERGEEADRRAGYTRSGPHRDSLRIELSGKDTKAYASRGQHRTVALSLKLALLLWARELLEEPPVFLLDDPGSELDSKRLGFLGSFLSRWNGQVIVACTPEANVSFDRTVDPVYYRVSKGSVYPLS